MIEKYLNKITLGDSYELIKELPDKSIDLIVTDPPYLIENTKAGGDSKLSKSIQGMNDELANGILTQGINEEILDDFMRVMKVPNIYIWCNHKQIPMYLNYFVIQNKCAFDIIIWHKPNAAPLFSIKAILNQLVTSIDSPMYILVFTANFTHWSINSTTSTIMVAQCPRDNLFIDCCYMCRL